MPGERALAARFVRDLGTLATRVDALRGKRILLVGHGHSAANAINRLATLAHESPETRVVWGIRSLNRFPCVDVPSDPLPERRRIVSQANALAAQPPGWLRVERRAFVESFHEEGNVLHVQFSGGRSAMVDEVIGLTGYRPDLSFLSELTLEIAPSTEGPARLARALANVTDCLSIPSLSPADLETGESGFYFAGAKRYGRSRTFLLQSGYQQIESILSRLDSGDEGLAFALVEAAPDALIVVDAGGTIALVNAQAEALFGYPRSELIGKPVEVAGPHADRTRGGTRRPRHAW